MNPLCLKNELFRASAITEPRAAAFNIIAELPLLPLSFGARDFFLPFWGADVATDFCTSVVFLSSFEDFSLSLTSEVGVGGGLSSTIVKN